MAKNNNLTDFLTGVADAIRRKRGTTGKINPQNFEEENLRDSDEKAGRGKDRYSILSRGRKSIDSANRWKSNVSSDYRKAADTRTIEHSGQCNY